MKRLLLLVSAFVLTLGLTGCSLFGGGDDTGITSVTINGLENQTAYTETVVDLLDGVTVTADDGTSYTDLLDVDSDNCEVTAAGTVTAANPIVCTVTFTAVVEGIVARQSITVTFENEPIVVNPDAPLVKGWYFDSDADLTGWGVFTDGGGVFNSDGIEDGAWKLDVTTSTNSYGVRKDFMGVPIEANETYTVTFMAKSSVADKKIHVQMGELVPAPTYFVDFMPGQDQYFTLTTEWAEYTFSFEMGDAANANGGILFSFGDLEGSVGINAVIYLDDIEIRGGSGEDTVGPKIDGAADVNLLLNDTFDVNAGVTAADLVDGDLTSSIVVGGDTLNTATAGTYEVTYTVSDEAGNETVVTRTITVYDFSAAPTMAQWTFTTDTDLLGWSFDNSVKAISGAIDAGALKVTYTNGGNTWEPRFYNQGLPFENGETYMVSFKAKSDVAGKIIHLQTGELLSADPWFTNFKTTTDIAELTTEWQTFFYIFDMTIDNENGGLVFELGNYGSSVDISGNVWIDDLTIVGGTGVDTLGPQIIGADDVVLEVGETFTATDGVVAVDLTDGDLTSSIVVTGDTVDTATAGEYELTYTVEDAAGNETVVTRTVTVIAVVLDDNNDEMFDIFDQTTVLTDDDTMDWWLNNSITEGEEDAEDYKEATLVASTRNGVLSILHDKGDFDSISTNNLWDAIVFYQSLNLLEGVDYMITFEAKTDLAGNDANSFLLKLENGDWSAEKFFVLTNEFADYSFTFSYEDIVSAEDTIEANTTLNAFMMFMVGGIEQTISIQNLEIYIDVAEADTPNIPLLDAPEQLSILLNETIDLLDYVSAEDLEDGELTLDATNITVAGPSDQTTFDSSVAGDWTITYSYTDTDGNEGTAVMTVTVYNFTTTPTLGEWDFEDNTDLDDWSFDAQGATIAGTIFTEGENDVMQVVYTAGGQPYMPRIFIQGVPFEQDTTYLVQFKAKSDVAGKIMRLQAGELLTSDPWFTVFTSETDLEYVELTTEWVTYYYIFDMALDNQNGGILFELGNYLDSVDVDGTIWIDDIQIIGGSGVDSIAPALTGATDITLQYNATFDATDGVEAHDFVDGDLTSAIVISGDTVDTSTPGVYTVTYTVTDAAGNITSVDRIVTVLDQVVFTDTGLIQDGTFDINGWGAWFGDEWSGYTTSTVSVENGELIVDVTYDTQPSGTHATQVFQEGFAVTNGSFYRISFDAYADEAKDVIVAFGDALDADPWFTNFVAKTTFNLTTSVQTFTLEFEMLEATTTDQGKLVFELGTAVQTMVHIDNVKVEEIDALEGNVVADSDQVTNGTFDVAWGGWYGDEWSGYTSSSFRVVDGMLEITVEGVTAGTASHATQVFQENITITEGQTYRVVFDAYADAARKMNVALGEPLNYDPYFNNFMPKTTIDLTTSSQEFEFFFTMDQATNELGKLVFELGGIDGEAVNTTVYIDNVRIEALDQEDILANGDFSETGTLVENGWGAWFGDQWSGYTSSTVDFVNGELVIDVSYETQPSGTHATQVYQEGFAVTNGSFYRITFDAYADEAKDIIVAFGDALDYDPWFTNYVAKTTFNLTTSVQTFTLEFEMTEVTTADQGKLVFELGTAVQTMVHIDNVKIEEIDALAGNVVADTDQVVNGTFEDLTKWGAWFGDQWSGYTSSSVSVIDGVLEVAISGLETTTASHATQVFQEPFTIEEGVTYIISFDAYADDARQMNVNLGEGLDYDPYFNPFMDTSIIDLTTSSQHFQIEFTMAQVMNENGKLVFELGTIGGVAVNTTVYIDNVQIYAVYY